MSISLFFSILTAFVSAQFVIISEFSLAVKSNILTAHSTAFQAHTWIYHRLLLLRSLQQQLSWLLKSKNLRGQIFWPVINSSTGTGHTGMHLKSGWMGSHKYFIILLIWKLPRSLQTAYWQRWWVCWKIKICSFVYLSFKWVRLKRHLDRPSYCIILHQSKSCMIIFSASTLLLLQKGNS